MWGNVLGTAFTSSLVIIYFVFALNPYFYKVMKASPFRAGLKVYKPPFPPLLLSVGRGVKDKGEIEIRGTVSMKIFLPTSLFSA